jgi:hypothetical protein
MQVSSQLHITAAVILSKAYLVPNDQVGCWVGISGSLDAVNK